MMANRLEHSNEGLGQRLRIPPDECPWRALDDLLRNAAVKPMVLVTEEGGVLLLLHARGPWFSI